MKVCARTDIGKKRSSNQDTFRYSILSEKLLWVLVCDGMGGVNGGDIASATAAGEIEKILDAQLNEELSDEEIRQLMIHAVNEANSAVFAKSVDDPQLKGMGTTAVLAVLKDCVLHMIHIGDSRAYLKTAEGTLQITEDHSFVQDLVNRGEITKEQARTHPHKNIITRSLGVHSMVESDYARRVLHPGEILMMCSDGLSDYLTEESLDRFLTGENDPEKLVDALIAFALDSGGNDNVTVAVVCC